VGTWVVLRDGPRVSLVGLAPPREVRSFGGEPERGPRSFLHPSPADLPRGLGEALRQLGSGERVVVADEPLLAALGLPGTRRASLTEMREARAVPAKGPRPDDRRFVLALAREALEEALRSPEEVLIALAREEERLERAVGREERAAASFIAVAGTALATYGPAWEASRRSLAQHHAALTALLEESARELVPNLSEVVGERVAARLVALAGGLRPLGRMSAGRIQVLGARRRPSAERGPRFGVLYRGARMSDVPVERRGAYARSLAALAALAARADATTRARLGPRLVARRDRRIERLRGRVS
jgi:snoRNA binding domain, fibrillarin